MKLMAAVAVIAILQTATAQQPMNAQTRSCLHGSAETPAEKTRRDAAIRFARALTEAETNAKRNGKYVASGALTNLPETPAGFRLQITTDGATYMFSLKDTLDVCGFALFSDQQGFIYEGAPVNRPGIRLLTGS